MTGFATRIPVHFDDLFPVSEQCGLYICPEEVLAGLDTADDLLCPCARLPPAIGAEGRQPGNTFRRRQFADQYRAEHVYARLVLRDLLRTHGAAHAFAGTVLP